MPLRRRRKAPEQTANQVVLGVLRKLRRAEPGRFWQTRDVASAANKSLALVELVLFYEHSFGRVEMNYSREQGRSWRVVQHRG